MSVQAGAISRPARQPIQRKSFLPFTPRLGHVWLLAPAAITALAAGFKPVESVDLWWSLLATDSVSVVADPVVFTVVAERANPQWLGQRILAAVFGLGEFELLMVFRVAALMLTVFLAELLVLKDGASAEGAGQAVLIGLPLILAGGAVRPQLLALPLFALVLLIGGPLAGPPHAGLKRFTLGVVAMLWANVHGSFVLGPAALGLLALGGSRSLFVERLLLAAVAAAAALVNPWGPGLYGAVLEVTLANSAAGAQGLALEWKRLDLTSLPGIFFIMTASLATLGCLRGRFRTSGWLTLAAPLALLALSAARHSTWFALAAAPLAARGVTRQTREREGDGAINTLLLAILCLATVFGFARPALAGGRLASDTPVELAGHLAELEVQRIFCFSDWSGYLAWRLGPDLRTFVDNRFEAHSAETWAAYRRISLAEEGWGELLEQHGVQALALHNGAQKALMAAAAASPQWRESYADERGRIYVRQ
jgi:hypothetical protein